MARSVLLELHLSCVNSFLVILGQEILQNQISRFWNCQAGGSSYTQSSHACWHAWSLVFCKFVLLTFWPLFSHLNTSPYEALLLFTRTGIWRGVRILDNLTFFNFFQELYNGIFLPHPSEVWCSGRLLGFGPEAHRYGNRVRVMMQQFSATRKWFTV